MLLNILRCLVDGSGLKFYLERLLVCFLRHYSWLAQNVFLLKILYSYLDLINFIGQFSLPTHANKIRPGISTLYYCFFCIC